MLLPSPFATTKSFSTSHLIHILMPPCIFTHMIGELASWYGARHKQTCIFACEREQPSLVDGSTERCAGGCSVALGYDEGTVLIKIGREEPVASMDGSGKIIWARHNEIQTVNVKSLGADFEDVSLPSCSAASAKPITIAGFPVMPCCNLEARNVTHALLWRGCCPHHLGSYLLDEAVCRAIHDLAWTLRTRWPLHKAPSYRSCKPGLLDCRPWLGQSTLMHHMLHSQEVTISLGRLCECRRMVSGCHWR